MRDFGAKADGITLNVATIQKVIDFSHEQGGGRVAFTLGDFVTGLIYLKLGVTKCEVVRKRKDYRPAIVLDDVHNRTFKNVSANVPG